MTTPGTGRTPAISPRSVLWLVIAVLVATGVVWFATREGSPDTGSSSGPRAVSESPIDREAAALHLLAGQQHALRGRGMTEYTSTWAGNRASQDRASTIYRNLAELTTGPIQLRYVAQAAGQLKAEAAAREAARGWNADVEVVWRQIGAGSRPIRSTVSYTFVEVGRSVLVSDVAASDYGRAPVWLIDSLDVRSGPRVLAVATTPQRADKLAAQLQGALRAVHDVIPEWRGRLVAYFPETVSELESMTGADPGGHDGIAAVVTTIDGARSSRTAAAIMLNPEVFDSLGGRGQRVVIAHEAAHIATGAATATMPLWVVEGFADYVGVGAVNVPVLVSGGLALKEVRADGPPRTLPTDDQFDTSSKDLETSYELSWLAARLIAQDHGEADLVDFYRAVAAEPHDVAGAFRSELGTTEVAFTAQWRNYLVGLADAG